MTTSENKKQKTQFVDCDNCSMQAVCEPVTSNAHELNLADNYLSKRIPLKAGEVLFSENEPLSSFYAVSSGSFVLTEVKNNNESKIIGFRFPGELIGEDAIYPEKYGYNAVATTASSVCRVVNDKLMSCSKLVPDLQLNVIKLLSKQNFTRQSEFRAAVAKKSAENVLASFLVNIAQRNTLHDACPTVLNLAVSRDNIANFLGLRRETLSRLLTRLQQDGLIKVEGKTIYLLDIGQLEKLADI
ncbi:helix-turn-helix domain-containing protein [Thalassotalea sp. PLHSN55]|uniref:helix-turn-helix domain-containing protein n=1 Tax=Thalassotalea sp. PLHSN55 TaxID=3435888 RepID=UPI003F843F41